MERSRRLPCLPRAANGVDFPTLAAISSCWRFLSYTSFSDSAVRANARSKQHDMPLQYLWLLPLGLLIGAFGTLIGAGGGFILVPILLLIYPNENTELITSVSLAVVFFNALSGSWAYSRMKRIDYKSGIIFSIATIPGAILGAVSTAYVPRQIFDIFFGVIMVIAGIFLWLSATDDHLSLLKLSASRKRRRRLIALDDTRLRRRRRRSPPLRFQSARRDRAECFRRFSFELAGRRWRIHSRAGAHAFVEFPGSRRHRDLPFRVSP